MAEGLPKRRAQIAHAKRRSRERFGVHLNCKRYHEVVLQIHQSQAQFVERQSARVTVWLVRMPSEEPAFAVYDQKRRVISTFLQVLRDRKASEFGSP